MNGSIESALTKKPLIIIGLNWLGDAIMSMPAIEAYHALYPEKEICIATKPGLKTLWEMHPHVDRIINLGDESAIEELKQVGASQCVIFPNSFRSAYLAWRAKLPHRKGLATGGRGILLHDKVTHAEAVKKKHQAYEYFSLLGLDIPDKIPNPSLAGNKSADRQGVAFIPGSARGASKQWPKEKFIELGLLLLENTSEKLFLLGTQSERPLCQEIKDALGQEDRVRNLAGETSLKELAQRLSESKAAVMTVGACISPQR